VKNGPWTIPSSSRFIAPHLALPRRPHTPPAAGRAGATAGRTPAVGRGRFHDEKGIEMGSEMGDFPWNFHGDEW